VASLLVSPAFVAWFFRHEARLAQAGGDPLVAIEAFRSPGLLRGLGAIMTLYAMATFFLTYSIYLQTALGFTAFQAGLGILPFSAGFLIGSTYSSRFARLLGTSTPSWGFALSATGAVATALLTAYFPPGLLPPWPLMVPALGLIGLGMGITMPTMVRVIVERVEPHRAGLVGGMVNTTLQVSAAVSIAVLGGLFFTLLGTRTDAGSVTHAFATTLFAIAACHLGGALLAAGLGQRRQICLST
jgi:MFS family permease